MGEGIRIELTGALAGHHIVVDSDKLTMGFLEDLEGPTVRHILDSTAGAILSSDIPGASTQAEMQLAVRNMKRPAFMALVAGIKEAYEVPLAS
jgi:hypothetical protein